MSTLYLVVRIAGQIAALPAETVGSVAEIEEISPVPRVAAHVAGLFALRSRVLTVIDSSAALGLGTAPRDGVLTAVITVCDSHSYALLVDAVDDVIEAAAIEACPAVLANGWARAARGAVRHGDGLLLVLDPAMLIAGCRPLAA